VGIVLTWDLVNGADGYVIQASPNGDFSGAVTLAQITNGAQTSYFDNTPASGTKKYYKIAATAGTLSLPQSVTGGILPADSVSSFKEG
jgi:fibronectin type 3 domain-containing protein